MLVEILQMGTSLCDSSLRRRMGNNCLLLKGWRYRVRSNTQNSPETRFTFAVRAGK